MLSHLATAATVRPAVVAQIDSVALDGSLRGRIVDRSGGILVIGHGHFGSIGEVNFKATFNETVGLDTISLTGGRVTLENHAVDLTLSVSPATAVVPRNQFHARFAVVAGGSGSGSFAIPTFTGSRFVAKLHSAQD